MTRLTLNRPHTHAGRLYAPGAVLDVDPRTADWLIAEGVAQQEPAPEVPQTVPAEPEPEPKAKSRSNSYPRQEPQA